MNATLDYRIPRGEGPVIGNVPVLEGFGLNLQWQYGSGYPYTSADQETVEPTINCQRYPRNLSTDLRLNKTFWTGPLAIDLFCEVRNLFNRHNTVDIKDVSWYQAGWFG